MESDDVDIVLGADPLPLPSLQLLVSPLQLRTARMWRAVHQLEIQQYWEVAQFVSVVMDMVPELLLDQHWNQLNSGLRAKYILELCRAETGADPQHITALLDAVARPNSPRAEQVEVEEEEVGAHFAELVQLMLKDPEAKQHFFTEVFPVAYGPDYDQDLLTLFEELLFRLAQLLPVPDLRQTVSWLGSSSTVQEEASIPSTHLRGLLGHHRQLGHLEQHVPPSSMGDRIQASLASPPPDMLRSQSPPPQVLGDTAPPASLADVVAEVVMVTDYAEVELGTTAPPPEEEEEEGGCLEETEAEEGAPQGGSAFPDETKQEQEAGAVSPDRPHACPDCQKRFRFASSLSAHRVVHTRERPHRCSTCGRCFSFRQSLDRHKHTHETAAALLAPSCEEPPAEEQEVGAEGDGVEVAVDAVGALAPALVEQVVSLVTVRTSGRKRRPTMKVQVINLQKHLGRGRGGATAGAGPKRRKQGGATAPFNSAEHSYGTSEVLPGCIAAEDAVQGGSSEVLTGSVDIPQAPANGSGCQGNDADPSSPLLRDGRFGCPDCDKSFRFRSLLASHRRVHTGEQPYLCTQCGRRFSFKQSLERHRRTHGASTPANPGGCCLCAHCGRSFSGEAALLRHTKTHGEETPGASGGPPQAEEHACDCGKSFAYRAALTAHRRVHREERPYACAHCPKRFLYRGALQSHAKTHSEDKPHACSFCGKAFKRERNMKKHERCHTREDVFRCSQCDKSFVYKATLTRHELTHSGQRPFLCSACGKGFYSHAELLKHERFHTGHKPFQCPFCAKRFTQSCYLTVHVRYHTGARPYACADCDKSFLSANRLKRHRQTHTGEKPYECTECGRGFRQSYHLKVHLRTHAYA